MLECRVTLCFLSILIRKEEAQGRRWGWACFSVTQLIHQFSTNTIFTEKNIFSIILHPVWSRMHITIWEWKKDTAPHGWAMCLDIFFGASACDAAVQIHFRAEMRSVKSNIGNRSCFLVGESEEKMMPLLYEYTANEKLSWTQTLEIFLNVSTANSEDSGKCLNGWRLAVPHRFHHLC